MSAAVVTGAAVDLGRARTERLLVDGLLVLLSVLGETR
jgi:hypothetical protein